MVEISFCVFARHSRSTSFDVRCLPLIPRYTPVAVESQHNICVIPQRQNNNQKTWQSRMHCNLRPPEPRQLFPALITTRCQFEVAEPIHCRIIPFLLLVHYSTPWPWPLTPWPCPLTFDLEHLQCIVCDVMKLCTKFERNRTIRGGVIAISIFDLMTLKMF